jgi:EmrB/QacA subfamily drug resistance transporter
VNAGDPREGTRLSKPTHANAAPESVAPEPEAYKAPIGIIGALMVALLLSALDNTIVGTALATIAGKLGGIESFTWVTTAYIACSTVATLLLGKLSDLYGRRNLLLFSIGVFILASLLCGAAQSMNQLIAARALQGIGGGGIWGLTFATIGDIVPPRERGRYFGLFTSVFALASVIGPLVGGVIVDNVSWRWIFLVNLPLGAVSFVMLYVVLKLPKPKSKPKIDVGGAVLLSASVGALMVSLERGSKSSWTSPTILLGFGVAAGALVLLLIWERRVEEPILPLRLFRNRNLRVVFVLGFLVGPALMTVGTFFSLYFQDVRGLTPTRAGLQGVPMMVGMVLGSSISGRVITKTGRYKKLPLVGFLVTIVGVGIASRTTATTPLLLIASAMGLSGLGTGLTMPTLSIVSQNSAEQRDLGVASATSNFMRSLGGAVALAVMGVWFSAHVRSGLVERLPGNENASEMSELIRSPEEIRALPPDIRDAIGGAISHAVGQIFLVSALLALLGFFGAWLLREEPLRGGPASGVAPAE